MSLGWLTESSLIPKDPKPIQGVGRASLIGLQAAVYDREQRGPALTAKRRRKLAEAVKNEGVDSRGAKDERECAAAEVTLELSSAKLKEKARRYEAMMAGKEAPCKDLLVDFAGKEREHTEVADLREVEAAAPLEEPQEEAPAFAVRNAIAPPACLAVGIVLGNSTGAASIASFAGEPSAADAVGERGSTASQLPEPPAPASATAGAVKQMFERPLSSMEDRAHAERLSQHTDLCRETVGPERRQARDAVRERLAALRAGKRSASSAEGAVRTGPKVLQVLE
mmetsp:Transcript_28534/g.46650  ORF Transcript_28534/g.46650 Transcript_28534/m.46650 type:complete len:282 (-) Transcript_28534:10-855(-)